jgi:hypothetical protein
VFELKPSKLTGCFELQPKAFDDARGRFVKAFHEQAAAITAGVGLFMNTDTVLHKMLNPYALSKGQFSEWGRYFAQ